MFLIILIPFQVFWKLFFKGTSSQDGGTLFQLRNLINRRNIVANVKTDMNATEDFFEVVTAGHIVAVTLHTCGMTDLEDTPHVPAFDVDIDELSPQQKWLLLSRFIHGILEHHVKPSMEIQGLQRKAVKSRKRRKDDSDHVRDYACVLLSAGLFMAELRDAVKEGDGNRMDRVWKYLLLFFRSTGRTKYALEALYLQFQKLTLSPRLQKQLLWSRFVNSRGGVGRNISCDLHMEHLNRTLKTALAGLGANVSNGSITRASKCLKVVADVTANFDNTAGVPFVSEKHSQLSYKRDLNMIVQELHIKSRVFHPKPKRHHRSFRSFNSSLFKLNGKKSKAWFKRHLKDWVDDHTPE